MSGVARPSRLSDAVRERIELELADGTSDMLWAGSTGPSTRRTDERTCASQAADRARPRPARDRHLDDVRDPLVRHDDRPFDGFNTHDLRDFASFYLALGLVLLVAAARSAWRFPLLVLATLEYGFHTINHAIDVNNSDPSWLGPAELATVAAGTAIFAWLAWLTAPRRRPS
jgi:hypothetical protein